AFGEVRPKHLPSLMLWKGLGQTRKPVPPQFCLPLVFPLPAHFTQDRVHSVEQAVEKRKGFSHLFWVAFVVVDLQVEAAVAGVVTNVLAHVCDENTDRE